MKVRPKWERTKTSSGNQRFLNTTVYENTFKDMKEVSPILVELNKIEEGLGIKENNPSQYIRYCIIEKTKELIEKKDELLEKIKAYNEAIESAKSLATSDT
jgi:hypothetical protein